jgi:F420-non-reducing hydrogenase iron-sulfur subunit
MATDEANPEKPKSLEQQQPVPEGWKANIIAFACHYCAFAAADLAGVMRLSYPVNVKVVRLPCTGKLDQLYMLRAFERGVDGIFAAG